MVDVSVIGAGVAGLTAAVYACRAGLSVAVYEKAVCGGQIALTNEIENYPAFLHITGPELSELLQKHAAGQGAEIRFEEVVSLELNGPDKRIVTGKGEEHARSVILALGAKRRKLGIPGEEDFTGRGVSYCATCDGAFFRKKTVAVCGGGNAALEEALYLSKLCERVILIHRRENYRAERALQEAVYKQPNIERQMCRTVLRAEGSGRLERIITAGTGQVQETEESISVSGLFISIGYEPDNTLVSGQLALDSSGYIRAGEDCRTSLSGVYAAGDCRTKQVRQIVTAAADGAAAVQQITGARL